MVRRTNRGAQAAPPAKDPVCGMRVDLSTAAATVRHDGVTYVFCSQHCADTFRTAPADFVA